GDGPTVLHGLLVEERQRVGVGAPEGGGDDRGEEHGGESHQSWRTVHAFSPPVFTVATFSTGAAVCIMWLGRPLAAVRVTRYHAPARRRVPTGTEVTKLLPPIAVPNVG